MIPFTRLVSVEARRALSRRAVWALIGVALAGIALTGLLAFLASNDFDPAGPEPDIARLTSLWHEGDGESVLAGSLIILLVGALIGGATVTGAEWQHGTIVTVSTWEVRRVRLLLARILSAMGLATLIGGALVILLCLSLVPTHLLRGTTSGADADFWRELVFAIGRLAGLAGLAAGLGASVASIGRRTTVAIGAAFAYLAIVESTIRALWPARGRWLLGENTAVLATAADLDGAAFSRDVATAALTLGGYVTALVAVAVWSFHRRDLAGAS